MDPLVTMAREVLDGNRYMVLGTVEDEGPPRLSPVYFTHHDYRAFYWVSAPDAQHSKNLGRRPGISIVVFDSSAEPGEARAVYLRGTAREVPDNALTGECEVAFAKVGDGARAFKPAELSSPEPLRLYRATASSYAVHIPGGDPAYGTGIDSRKTITMP